MYKPPGKAKLLFVEPTINHQSGCVRSFEFRVRKLGSTFTWRFCRIQYGMHTIIRKEGVIVGTSTRVLQRCTWFFTLPFVPSRTAETTSGCNSSFLDAERKQTYRRFDPRNAYWTFVHAHASMTRRTNFRETVQNFRSRFLDQSHHMIRIYVTHHVRCAGIAATVRCGYIDTLDRSRLLNRVNFFVCAPWLPITRSTLYKA